MNENRKDWKVKLQILAFVLVCNMLGAGITLALISHSYKNLVNLLYQLIMLFVVIAVTFKFIKNNVTDLIFTKVENDEGQPKSKSKPEYKKRFIVTIFIIFVCIPVLVQFCPQILAIFHFKTSDSPTWIGYWGNILGSVLGIVGAFVVSAKYADSGDKKEGPRGPEGPQGPRGPEGPSGSPSDYSGIIEAINQVNTSIEKNRNRNYRNEQALHRYILGLIDLKKELNDTYGVQEDFLKKLSNLIRSTRFINNNYYYGTPMYEVINRLNNNNLNVYSANDINQLIDDLIYYSL